MIVNNTKHSHNLCNIYTQKSSYSFFSDVIHALVVLHAVLLLHCVHTLSVTACAVISLEQVIQFTVSCLMPSHTIIMTLSIAVFGAQFCSIPL